MLIIAVYLCIYSKSCKGEGFDFLAKNNSIFIGKTIIQDISTAERCIF